MVMKVLKLTGNILYFIGALILVPAGIVFLASPNTLMLAGPIVLLVPLLGVTLAGTGRWLIHKALQLEKGAAN